jgi:hypothetical protein
MVWLSGLNKILGYVTDTGPILHSLFVLSAHLNVETSVQNFLIIALSDEVNSVDFHLEDNFKGSRVVVFDLDEFKVREGLLDVLLCGVKIALDEVESDVFDLLIEILYLLNELVSGRDGEFSPFSVFLMTFGFLLAVFLSGH